MKRKNIKGNIQWQMPLDEVFFTDIKWQDLKKVFAVIVYLLDEILS